MPVEYPLPLPVENHLPGTDIPMGKGYICCQSAWQNAPERVCKQEEGCAWSHQSPTQSQNWVDPLPMKGLAEVETRGRPDLGITDPTLADNRMGVLLNAAEHCGQSMHSGT